MAVKAALQQFVVHISISMVVCSALSVRHRRTEYRNLVFINRSVKCEQIVTHIHSNRISVVVHPDILSGEAFTWHGQFVSSVNHTFHGQFISSVECEIELTVHEQFSSGFIESHSRLPHTVTIIVKSSVVGHHLSLQS